ncbi:MAG: chemotaxis protein CheW [Methylococcales bacterium]|nr:chemotaxis protein CheW [Methylococcales bacterium]
MVGDIGTKVEQFLTFELADEAYGVDILKVQEIRGWESVRKIPNTPDYIKGALNLRGSIVPIVDLRERFGMEKTDYSPVTIVIVLCVNNLHGENVMGIVADAVSDVLDIKIADIKESPKLGSKIDIRYIRGMYVGEKKMVMLLDTDKLLDSEEFEGISNS